MNRASEKWPIDEAWADAYRCLLEYVEEHGHLNVPENFQTDDGFALGAWVADQRTRRMRQTINSGEESQLDRLRFVWDEHTKSWYQHLEALEAFVDETGHAAVPGSRDQTVGSQTYRLGRWVATQRKKYQQDKLSEHHVHLLESFPEWKWTPKRSFRQARIRCTTSRQDYVQALRRFVLREGHTLVPRSYSEVRDGTDLELGRWVSTQRRRFQKGRIKGLDLEELESFLGWVWSSEKADFRSHLLACEQFVARNGHMDVPEDHTERFAGEQFQVGRFLEDLERRAAEDQLTAPETEALIEIRIGRQLHSGRFRNLFGGRELPGRTEERLQSTTKHEQRGLRSTRDDRQRSPDPVHPADLPSTEPSDLDPPEAALSGKHSTMVSDALTAIRELMQPEQQVLERLWQPHALLVEPKGPQLALLESSSGMYLRTGRDSGRLVPDFTWPSESDSAEREGVEFERWCSPLRRPTDPEQLGPWDLKGRVGSGGQSDVYLGRSDSEWASVKVPHIGREPEPEATARLEHEVDLLYQVREEPKFFPKVIDGGLEEARPWVALEFISGGSLDSTTFPLARLNETALGVAQALQVLHGKYIVHGDITPSNVLLTGDGPVVIDFGMAFHPQFPRPSTTGGAGGTNGYRAPEPELTPASDVRGWAATLYALVNGFPPGEGDALSATRVISVTEMLEQIQDGPRRTGIIYVVCGKAVNIETREGGIVRFELIDANGTAPLKVMLLPDDKNRIQRKVAQFDPGFDLMDELASPTLWDGTLRVRGPLRSGSDPVLFDMYDLVAPTSGTAAELGGFDAKLAELIGSALDPRPEKRPTANQIVERLENT
mgnify:FL=1